MPISEAEKERLKLAANLMNSAANTVLAAIVVAPIASAFFFGSVPWSHVTISVVVGTIAIAVLHSGGYRILGGLNG